MTIWHVTGGRPLRGRVEVQGAKNAVLPVIAASLLCPNETELTRCPALSDVDAAVDILRTLDCAVERRGDTLRIDTRNIVLRPVPRTLTGRMRSSVIFLGPILARFGEARVSVPGGCELGRRPIDLHLAALRALGAEIREEGDAVCCRAASLRGAEIPLRFPSVGATENAMIAACAARGPSVIYNAAREPEIETLQEYLRSLGAMIYGAGSPVIRVDGFSPRERGGVAVPADRIAAATWLSCAVCAGGDLELVGAEPRRMMPVLCTLETMGVFLKTGRDSIHIRSRGRPESPGAVVTRPYPGFPTDAAPLLMAAAVRSRGASVFIENIFEHRSRHAEELRRLGADILLRGPAALVNGVDNLRPGTVTAPDLRGGAALVAAALGTEGETLVLDPGHIRRGYDGLDAVLRSLGADVWCEETV